MNAMPTPPMQKLITVTQKSTEKTTTIDPDEVKPKRPFVRRDHLTSQPLRDHHELASLRDRLEFAPKGEHHQKKEGKR